MTHAPTVGRRPGARTAAAVRGGVVVLVVCAYAWRIFGIEPIERFGDDFFYYVVPASNWVDGAGSTFFPGEPTNGYHPLWFLWVALLHLLAGSGTLFFGVVDLTIVVLLVVFLLLFERFLVRVTGDRFAAVVGAAVATITMSVIAMTGVETALTAATAALLLSHVVRKPLSDNTLRDAAVLGFLAALLTLSRLDAAMLAPGLIIAVLGRWDWRRVLAALAGAWPVYVYLAVNMALFGQPNTTSMAAKSLNVYWPPNFWFVTHPWPIAPVVTAAIVVAAAVAVALLRRTENIDARRIATGLAVAPVLQLAAQALLSGWMLFPWYYYYFLMTLGLVIALVIVELDRRGLLRRVGIPVGVVLTLAMPTALVLGLLPDRWQVQIAATATRLQAFSTNHPGVYAIGDAAGTPGWLVDQPIVQLEGLMMSHDFLDRIRQRQSLEQVFHDYRVDYYVTVRSDGVDARGCPRFVEPSPELASPRAPHLEMTICVAPVEVISQVKGYDVRIYRIDPNTGKPV